MTCPACNGRGHHDRTWTPRGANGGIAKMVTVYKSCPHCNAGKLPDDAPVITITTKPVKRGWTGMASVEGGAIRGASWETESDVISELLSDRAARQYKARFPNGYRLTIQRYSADEPAGVGAAVSSRRG